VAMAAATPATPPAATATNHQVMQVGRWVAG
jgi:hypothetical protein